MEEEIVAVCEHSVLYDTTSYLHGDQTKKEIAWRKVSQEVRLSGKFWKYSSYRLHFSIQTAFFKKAFKKLWKDLKKHKFRLFANWHCDVVICDVYYFDAFSAIKSPQNLFWDHTAG